MNNPIRALYNLFTGRKDKEDESPIPKYDIDSSIIANPDKGLVKRVVEDLAGSYSPRTEQQIMEATSGSSEQYVADYLRDPLGTVRRENTKLPKVIKKAKKDIKKGGITVADSEYLAYLVNQCSTMDAFDIRQVLKSADQVQAQNFVLGSAIRLHAGLEGLVFPEIRSPNSKNYQVSTNVGHVCEGDYLPSRQYELQENGVGNLVGEKIVIHKTSEEVLSYLLKAKLAGIMQGPNLQALRDIFNIIKKEIPYKGGNHEVGETMSLSPFADGGVCRHLSIYTQLCLQEAGIKSTIIKGEFMGSPHAWVEADLEEDGTYFRVLDVATAETVGTKEGCLDIWKEMGKIDPKAINTVWRSKPNDLS